ncbi:hypothetical protein HYPSUDRAFT_759268 [Hypholoma sublateritium FD-334 SS-4]|uniref:Uncharacterized protein n=1 Tax=Hypholoma sublateritium (strain FD-334 SS-4) TaxID=945553 RepID=A0A0D2L2U5_HYPSF|nr:hypothetical protein HYPSUDRAFT_759268 [Hypholoma sublateritium FD-334 SS-4]
MVYFSCRIAWAWRMPYSHTDLLKALCNSSWYPDVSRILSFSSTYVLILFQLSFRVYSFTAYFNKVVSI